ncbi:hypothetical protein [Hymenobacter terrenus]|uniref:hypothetical protein n=1 Tax=Hymenobacter terrenus TaxID=1629124 RepID=UPI000ACBC99A|nr:hypothetical protein [Hymenobacter terrenus]
MLNAVIIRRLLHRSGTIALLLVLLSATVVLAATITVFTAAYENATVRVEWEVNTENDVTGFELARKTSTETSYTTVTNVAPTGQRRYQYIDTNVFRAAGSTAAGGPISYRLTVHGPGGDQSFLTRLAGTPSAVQRSWGTIKSMFR